MSRRQKIKWSLLLSIAALLVMLLVMFFTSPVQNIGFALVFFAALLGFLVALGHLIIYARKGELGPQTRGRIVIVGVFITLLLMFRSAQSLNWVDALILLLVVGGSWFYSSRRNA